MEIRRQKRYIIILPMMEQEKVAAETDPSIIMNMGEEDIIPLDLIKKKLE